MGRSWALKGVCILLNCRFGFGSIGLSYSIINVISTYPGVCENFLLPSSTCAFLRMGRLLEGVPCAVMPWAWVLKARLRVRGHLLADHAH